MEACKHYYSVRYVRLPDLLLDLQAARDNGTFSTVLKKYTKPIVLIIDEWLLLKLTEAEARNLFELIHKRRKKSSTIFCSQFRESEWCQQICDGESTLADAIMDRISYDSYKIDIESVDPSKDLSMKEVYGLDPEIAKQLNKQTEAALPHRNIHLYEKFLLEYYRKEHPELSANASQIAWQLDDSENQLLPKMQTDIMLSQGNNILIIDAKYYSHMTQQQYGTNTLHSNNLYQIFTYVKNKEFELRKLEHTVSGMILYAQTDEYIIPNNTYQMSGNQISVRALNLNQDFSGIAHTLDDIIQNSFNN